jgi:glutathione peroxidase
MSVSEIPVASLQGEATTIGAHLGKGALVVNVASKCGLTPQYTALEQLQKTYAERGFTVLGFPCNQFGGQEPGTAEEIETFCSSTYGVTFPMFEKIDVNGADRHPVFAQLTQVEERESGEAGDVSWNFAKWLIDANGEPVARFSPRTTPDSPEVVEAIERLLG